MYEKPAIRDLAVSTKSQQSETLLCFQKANNQRPCCFYEKPAIRDLAVFTKSHLALFKVLRNFITQTKNVEIIDQNSINTEKSN